MTRGIPRLPARFPACRQCGDQLPHCRHAQMAYCSATCRSAARRKRTKMAMGTVSTRRSAARDPAAVSLPKEGQS